MRITFQPAIQEDSVRRTPVVLSAIAILLTFGLVLSAGGCAKKSSSSGDSLPADGSTASSTTSDTTSTLGGTVEKQPVSTQGGAAGAVGGSGTGSGGSGTSGSGSGSKGTGSSSTKPGSTTPAPGMKVKVLWWNDTSAKAPKNWEIVYGSSVIKPSGGSKGSGSVGPAAYGKAGELVIYPDGPTGKKIVVPFAVTADMQPDSEADAIHVSVSDSSVRVLGNPVFNVDQTYPRF